MLLTCASFQFEIKVIISWEKTVNFGSIKKFIKDIFFFVLEHKKCDILFRRRLKLSFTAFFHFYLFDTVTKIIVLLLYLYF